MSHVDFFSLQSLAKYFYSLYGCKLKKNIQNKFSMIFKEQIGKLIFFIHTK